MNDDHVYWSVAECNRRYGHNAKPLRKPCPQCGTDSWRTRWAVEEQFRSQYNPGECIYNICTGCGYEDGPFPS